MTPEREIMILKRRLDLTDRYWLRAAKKSLSGDSRELANRVALFEANPVDVVLSAPPQASQGGGGCESDGGANV